MTEAQIKQAVRERDGMACTRCGVSNAEHKRLTGRQLQVHRVVQGSEYSITLGVCVTLCRKCHDQEPRKIRTKEEIAREHAAYLESNPPPPRPRPATIAEFLAGELRAARAALRLTLKEAGERADVHYVAISRYESGKAVPTLESLYKLADAYGVEVSEIVPPNALGLLPKAKTKKPKE